MPEIGVDHLDEFAVLLTAVSYDRHGRIKTSDVPVEIPCMWFSDVTTTGGPDQNLSTVTGQVHVDRAIPLDSLLWKGRKADFPKNWPVDAPEELVIVKNFHDQRSPDGRARVRWCDVERHRDSLPAVA